MSFPRSAIFRTAQHQLEERGLDLATWLRGLRAEDLSHEEIAIRLRELGVIVTRETVRSWCARLNVAGATA